MNHPYVVFVYGIVVRPEQREETREVTRYDVFTGKPHTRTSTETVSVYPKWVEEFIAQREERIDADATMDFFEDEPVTAIDVNDGYLIGHKIADVDAVHGFDSKKVDVSPKDIDVVEERLVREGVAREDVGFVVGVRCRGSLVVGGGCV